MLKVSYSDCPQPVFIQSRPKRDFADLWIRKNIASHLEDQGQGGDTYTAWEATEAYMTVALSEAPAEDEVLADFEKWFVRAENWEPEDDSGQTIGGRVAELEEALGMILNGVTE